MSNVSTVHVSLVLRDGSGLKRLRSSLHAALVASYLSSLGTGAD